MPRDPFVIHSCIHTDSCNYWLQINQLLCLPIEQRAPAIPSTKPPASNVLSHFCHRSQLISCKLEQSREPVLQRNITNPSWDQNNVDFPSPSEPLNHRTREPVAAGWMSIQTQTPVTVPISVITADTTLLQNSLSTSSPKGNPFKYIFNHD